MIPIFTQTKLTLILAGIVGLTATHLGTAYFAYSKGKQSVEYEISQQVISDLKDQAKDLTAQQETFNASVSNLNKTLENHTQTTKVINTIREKEIEKPVYKHIIVPSSGMQYLADSAISLNQARISNSTLSSLSNSTNPTKE